jgi:dipeptidyl aminopeptidase/acylaminoacyl peptidase
MGQEALTFTAADGSTLCGTLRRVGPSGRHPCVVLCHGFGSYDDDLDGFVRLSDFLADAGYASFRFSFRGSDPYPDAGDIRPASRWVDDALAAVARVRRHPAVDEARVGLLGVSVGGGIVIQAAALAPWVRAVVALAPVADGEDWLRNRWHSTRGKDAWERFRSEVEADHEARTAGGRGRRVDAFDVHFLADRPAWVELRARFPRILPELTLAAVWDTFHFKPLFYARALAQPLCLVHGDQDDSVPLEHSRRVQDEAGGTKELRMLPGAPHCPWGTPHEPVFQRTAGEWFRGWL